MYTLNKILPLVLTFISYKRYISKKKKTGYTFRIKDSTM